MAEAPLSLLESSVPPEWVDYNGHMSDGYYAVAFGGATDALLDYLGLGAAYRSQTGCAMYTVEIHINFLRELRAGDPLRFTSLVLGADAKRLHCFHEMQHAQAGYVAATNEVLLLHVDPQPRAAPLPASALARVRQVAEAHAGLPRPPQAGRSIRPPAP